MNIAHWLARSANTLPQRPALVLGAANLVSYREFARRASAVAYALRHAYHCQSGDRVAVPINAKLHAREAAYILGDATTSLAFVSPEWQTSLDTLAAELPPALRLISFGSQEWASIKSGETLSLTPREPDDLAWLFYTSGTTGKPKGAMLSHRNLTAMTF